MSESVGFVREVKGDKVSFFLDKGTSLSFGQIVRVDSGKRALCKSCERREQIHA